jgi:hypothetical protein
MPPVNYPIVDLFLIPFIARFFLVFGFIGTAVGIGLIFNPERMHEFFRVMNRWISLRRSTKWLAIPHDMSLSTQRFRRLLGVVFIIAAIFSIYVLATQIDVSRIVAASGVTVPLSFSVWIMECAVWFLILGNMIALVVGIMLNLFPDALHEIEMRSNHWFSVRSHTRGDDTMHLTVDKWAESYPRTMGWIITAGSLIVVIDYAILLFAHS